MLKGIYGTIGINTGMGPQPWYRYMRNGAVAAYITQNTLPT